jgi:general L-amino acid transport system permease protein
MPSVKQSYVFLGNFVLNQRGLYVPKPLPGEQFSWVLAAAGIAVIAGIAMKIWAKRRLDATGKRFPVLLTFIALLVALPLLAWLTSGASLAFDMPELAGFNYRGGVYLPPELVALTWGLSIYTAAFIAETVRAGILSVSHGQTEAAQSLGLGEGDRLRLVVIPQAMRVIIPPLTSQYLNLTKNSSLGAAIAFPELVSVFTGTTLNQTGKAIEVISLTMLVYLTISLSVSALMNIYNARVALVER